MYDKKTGAKKSWAGAEDDASLEKLGLSRTPIQQAVANSTPQAAQPPTGGYESPYSSDIAKALRSISNMGSFSYDPSSDEGLQAAQDEAIAGVSRGAARRNMLYSDTNKSQMGKSALALVPQFEQNAFNRYQGQLGNLFNQLSTLTGLENQNYGRYRDTLNDQRTDQQNQLNNAYNMAQLTGQYIPGFTGQIDPSLSQYSNDFMAEINRRAATPDTADDVLIPQLQALRNLKIQSDPSLMNQYGSTMSGIPTLQLQQITQQQLNTEWERSDKNPAYKTQLLNAQIAEMELANLPEKQKLELQQLRKQIANIGSRPAQTAADVLKNEYELELYKQKLDDLKTNGLNGDSGSKTAYANAYSELYNQIKNGTARSWLQSNREALINDIGPEAYVTLMKEYNDYTAAEKRNNPYNLPE